MNIVDVIAGNALQWADKAALVDGAQRISYGELLARAEALGDSLRDMGIRPAGRVGFYCADGIEYVIGALAVLQAGAAMVPISDNLTQDEIREVMERMQLHGVLRHQALPAWEAAPGRTVGQTAFVWHAGHSSASIGPSLAAGSPAFIRFSSGTTGASKGVVLSHQSILERTQAANRGLRISTHDEILWVLGMSHHFVVSILLYLQQGATIILAQRDFPMSMLEAVAAQRVTFIYASPVHYHLLAQAESVQKEMLSKVRLAVSTAMKMPPAIARAFAQKYGFAPAEAYGIIEVGLPFLREPEDAAGEGSVGQALPDYEVRISQADAEGVGEVLVRGPGMFDAYYSPWRLRKDCLVDDGWFATGDLGRLDGGGRLHLRGRIKTVLICAGMKIFPEEVEDVISAAPGVREALVLAREHPQYGQVPIARIVLREKSGDPYAITAAIREHCLGKLSAYKVPVEYEVVDHLPRTASGKLRRH